MNGSQPPRDMLLAPDLSQRTGWRKYFTRQRLRLFILLSVTVHLALGLSWGVPAYVKQKRVEAEMRKLEAMRDEQRKAVETALAKAKAKDMAQTVEDVQERTRKAFEEKVADLKQAEKDKIWAAVEPKVKPAEQRLASALGDRSMTEQDQKNMEADLGRQLIEAIDQTLVADIAQEETAAFLEGVESRVAPELVGRYRSQLYPKVTQPVRAAADEFVKSARDDAAAAITSSDTDRRAVSDAIRHLAEALDQAAEEVDRAQALLARKPLPDEEIRKHIDSATSHLKTGGEAADTAAETIDKLIKLAEPLDGGADLAERLAVVKDSLQKTRDALKTLNGAMTANNHADAARQLTALGLSQRKLGVQWNSAADAAGRTTGFAEVAARGAVGAVRDKSIAPKIDRQVASAFQDKASQRLTDMLIDALKKRLATAGAKADETLLAATARRVREILETKVGGAGGYGIATSQNLRDLAGSNPSVDGVVGEKMAARMVQKAEPLIVAGVDEVIADASLDAHLADLVSKPEQDQNRDDVRDRVAMLAARASDGRTSAADSVSFTDLRANALARTAEHDKNATPDADAPTTALVDAPPVIEEVKKDILTALEKELRKVLDEKLPEDKTAKVWDHVAKASEADVSRLAQDLINPNVSDSDLESRRLDFSGKFLKSVGTALDKTAADDLKKELLKQLEGKAGDAVAGAYKNAVKENVGNALAREWRGAAEADRNAASQQVRDIRVALDSARSVADKASQILDQVKAQTQNADQNGKGDPKAVKEAIEAGRAKLQEIGAAVDGAKTDMAKARKEVPKAAAELKDRLGEIDKAIDDLGASVKDADKTGKAHQAAEFDKAVADARQQVDKFRESLNGAAANLDQQANQAEAQFAKAADQAKDDSASGAPGVKSRIEGKFDEAFRKEALPRLTNEIVKGFQQKLEKGGVNPDAKDNADLERAIAAALDKKVAGEAHVGEAAVGEVDRQHVLDNAKNAKGEPTAGQVERANAVADKVTAAGVDATVSGDAANGTARNAVNALAGPDHAVGELKDKVARMEGQLRGGRGGVLADAADGPEPADANGLSNMRRKWRGLLAGLNGEGEGDGKGGKAGAPGAAASAGGASGGGAAGTGSGSGSGQGAVRARHMAGSAVTLDREKYKKIVDALKDRGVQQGQAWDRNGADGRSARARRDEETDPPAAIVAPATQPVQSAKNDQPYAPTFKSLQFAVAPYLNKPIPIGENFDAWKDIPAIHFRPERAWLKDDAGLKVVDDLPVKIAWDNHGLYFMLDMIDPDNKIEKAHVENFWMCDAMEVFIDTMNTKETRRGNGAGQQFWCWPFGSIEDENAPGGESLYDRHSGFHFVGLKSDELQRYARKTADGYQVQWHVPTERVRDADLAPGKILGLNITVETGVKLHYYWSASKVVVTSVHPDTWGDVLLGGSDGRIDFPARLASEVGSAASAKTVSAFAVGEPLRIRVTDRDMNLNDKVKDKISVTVRNDRKEQEIAILEETGPDTGIFEGSVRTALSIGERVPGVINVYEGESVSVTYMDQARANGARNTQIISRIKAGPSVMVEQTK